VKDINPTGSSSPADITAIDSVLYFRADNGVHGRELWRSDGTEAGTVMVSDINVGPDGSNPSLFTKFGSWVFFVVSTGETLFFRADDGVHGEELWRTYGSAASTTLMKDTYPGPADGLVDSLTYMNGIVYFVARNAPAGWQLWRSDGREVGTFPVGEIVPGPGGDLPHDLTVAAPFLFLSSWGVEGNELFATDFVFADGFESSATDVWSFANTDGGDLSVQAEAALHGTFGLSALVDDTESLSVVDESPINDRHYRARFSLDPNGFDPGESNGKFRMRVLLARGDSSSHQIAVVLRRIGGQYSLMGKVRLDDGTRAQTPFVAITDEPHMVELDWEWSRGIDDHTGRFALWIDEVPVSALNGLQTHGYTVQAVQLGAMALKPGANGTLYFDDFESRRERYIGAFLP
jgi:ELWxxDGT repeat protein